MINWKISNEDFDTISAIVRRTSVAHFPDRRMLVMDLNAVHSNGNPLDLQAMLAADPADDSLLHDLHGITRYIDRETGKLTDHFTPRYSKIKAAKK